MIDFVICSVPKYNLGVPLQGPAVLKAALKRAGFSCLYLDLNEELGSAIEGLFPGSSWSSLEPIFAFEEEFEKNKTTLLPFVEFWADEILRLHPGAIGFSVFTQRSFFLARFFTETLRGKGFTRPILWGGSYASQCGKPHREAGLIDHYIIGAGERAIVEFAKGNRSFAGLNSHPVQSPGLKDYLQPDYSDLRLDRYRSMYITGSRSCPYSCSFCENPALWGRFSVRDPHQTAEEIRNHFSTRKTKTFFFTDNLINGHLPTYRILMEEILALRLPIRFDAFFVIRSKKEMPPSDFDLAKRAGARTIRIGVESGSERVRSHMGKKFLAEDLDYFLNEFQRVGIHTDLMLIVGYPTETEQDFDQTLRLLERYKSFASSGTISHVRIVPLAILPSAPLWQKREELGVTYDGIDIGDWRCGDLDREVRLHRYHRARSHALALGYKIRATQDQERNSLFAAKRSISSPLDFLLGKQEQKLQRSKK